MTTDLDVLLKEYDSLRAEVGGRINTAFSHLAFFGALAAFALKVPDCSTGFYLWATVILASLGSLFLLWIAVINWMWVGRIASHLQVLEDKINTAAGGKPLLTWEKKAKEISRSFLLPPKQYIKDS